MEDWRRTTEEASIQNLIDINMTIEAVQAIDDAHAHFTLAANIIRGLGQGLPYQPETGAGLHLPTAMDCVRSAILSTRRLNSYHAASGDVFSTGAARIGLQGTAPWWWQRWERHHADAAAHADMALQRLRSAWSQSRAAWYAVNLIPLSAWGPAAEQLFRRANDELAMAKAALERMRLAEFSVAWMLLSR